MGLEESTSNLRRGIIANVLLDGSSTTATLTDLEYHEVDEDSAEWLAMFHWWAG